MKPELKRRSPDTSSQSVEPKSAGWGGVSHPTPLMEVWHRLRPQLELRRSGVVYGLIIVVIAMMFFSAREGRPPYLAASNVANLLDQISLSGILAIGMTVLLISGNFDLSVGSLTALTAMSAAIAANEWGPIPAIAVGLTVGAIGGAINGLIHWKVGLNSFIITLGTLITFRGMTLLISGARSVNVAKEPREVLEAWLGDFLYIGDLALFGAIVLGIVASIGVWQRHRLTTLVAGASAAGLLVLSVFTTYPLRLSHSASFMFALLTLVWFVLRFTVTGRRLYATGGNIEAARSAGVIVARYRVVPFIFVGLSAGFAGVLWTSELASVDPNAFTAKELDVLAAAIIGGVVLTGGSGSVAKTIVGALLLQVLVNGFNILNVPPATQQVATGAIIVAAAALYMLADQRARKRA